MANEIVYFDSSETGAPTLNNAAGSLDAVLHACLVTGFRLQNLTGISVSGGVATATLAGHGYGDGRMVDISGATPAGLNGRKLITVTGSGTFTFDATGVPDGDASGGITARRSPLGWARPLTSGNVSIYTRTDPLATTMALRVDDSGSGAAGATWARWRMVESYTDLNAFTGPAPTASQYGGAGHYIPKGANNSNAKPWVLVGDSRTFYLFVDSANFPASSYSDVPQGLFAFGDLASFRAGDPYACIVAGSASDASLDASGFGSLIAAGVSSGSPQALICRPFSGLGPAVPVALVGVQTRLGGGSSGPAYPSPVDNGVAIQAPLLVSERSSAFSHPLRGTLRGVGAPIAIIPGGALHMQVLDNLIGSDRRWLIVGFQQSGNYGHAAFDITGPW